MSRTRRTYDERERLVREWDRSGLTAAEFARPRGLSAESLRRWGRAVRGALRTRSPKRSVPRSVELVELVTPRVVDEAPRRYSIEIVLQNGRRVALVGDIADERLVTIVAALERV